MNTNPLKLVQLKRSLLGYYSHAQIVQNILDHISSLGNLNEIKKDPEYVLYVCRLVESCDFKGKKKPNKKQIVLDVICRLYPEMNNETDLKSLDTLIEFLHANKRIIGVSRFYRCVSLVGDFLIKKLF
jgi:hypothetical protein